jgi:hypothetical protein
MTTIQLLLWIFYIALDVWINYRIIEVNDSRPNYLLMNIVRGAAFVVYGRLIWDASIELTYGWDVFRVTEETFYMTIYCLTSFWILFDLGLNRARNKHPLYIGQNSGWIDQYGFKYPSVYYLGKLCALAALVYSIAKIYQG